MSKAKQSMKDTIRAWAKSASRAEIHAVCEILGDALAFRTFGIEDTPTAEPKRGRPPGSKNRPKEEKLPTVAEMTGFAAD